MQLLPFTQYQTCSCYYATTITQLKHAAVAMHTQYQTCSRCHATNIAELKHPTVAMHTIPRHDLLLCNQYHSAQAYSRCHAHTISNMQPLPCNQYRWAKACNCCHAYDTKHELLLCNQYHSAQTYSYCHAYKTKHASVAMQPMSLKLNKQLLPCAQYHTCNCCHGNNVTQYT